MRALVTGAGGFLGSAICRQLLDRGVSVRGLGRNHYPQLASWGVELIQADIRDAQAVTKACAGVDVVFHTAAIAGIWGPRHRYEEINVQGTAQVIEACRSQRVPRLVHTSSPSVTFDATDQCGVDETTPYAQHWLCDYPRTKAIAEQMVLSANGPELLTCALRPHLIWGPGDPHLIPRLLERAAAGQLRRVGNGKNLIDIVYVDNAAAAHCLAAERLHVGSPVAGAAYFISQGEPVNCWDWIAQILALRGLQLPARGLTFRQAWYAGWMLETTWRLLGRTSEPRMTRFLAAQLALSHYYSLKKAQQDFGYTPQITTAVGMDRLAKWLANG